MENISKRHSSISLIIIVLLGIGCSSGFSKENEKEFSVSLTLKDAIDMAFKNNNDILTQESEIKAAKANLLRAQSEFLPKANFVAGYTHRDAVMSLPSTMLNSQPKDIGVFVGYNDENRVGVSLEQSIFKGGRDVANSKQAKLNLKAQEELLRALKLSVRFEVKRLYYGLILADETEKIATELLNQAEQHYEYVEKRYKENSSSKFDLLQSEMQVLKVTPQLVRAKKARKMIEAELKKIIGMKGKDNIEPQDKLKYLAIEINEDEFVRQAHLKRPELLAKSLGIDITMQGIEVAKAARRPNIDVKFNYEGKSDRIGDIIFDSNHNNWNVGIQLSMPIFDGFAAKAKIEEARARYDQATFQKEDITDRIALEIRHAILDLNEADSIINLHMKRIESVREILKIAEIRYANGVGTNLDVLDAQVSLSQVEKDLSEAIYDYNVARAYLERSIGEGL